MKRLPWVPYYRLVITDDLPQYEVDGVIYSVNATVDGLWTVKMRPTWRENMGVLAHELAHVQLNCLDALTMGLLRALMGKRFKRWTEARAYAIQTKYQNRDGGSLSVDSAAALLRSPHYGLNLTQAEAVAAIKNYL